MCELFGVEIQTINYHLKDIYKTGELAEGATIRKIRIVQQEGNRSVERELQFYNLDAVLKAEAEYDAFNRTQWILSDFDKEIQRFVGEQKL